MAGEKMDSPTDLDAIASLLKLFGGNTKTTSGNNSFTETTGTNLDQTDMAGLLRSALESNSGLASVTQGQRAAGLYNSSTNRLMTNDLLARLTARTAEAGASKTVTRTGSPTVVKEGGSDLLTKGALALTAAQKLGLIGGKKKDGSKGVASSIMSSAGDTANAAAYSLGGGAVPFMDIMAANRSEDPIGALIASQGWSGMPDIANTTAASSSSEMLSAPMLADSASYTGANGFGDIMADSFTGFTPEQIGTAPAAGDFTVPTEEEMAGAGNFLQAPEAPSNGLGNNPSASEVLSGAANTTLSVGQLMSGAGGSAMNLYSGISALTDGNSSNDLMGGVSTASGAYGAYKSYEAYQAYQTAQAAKAAADAAAAAEGASAAADTASSASSASSTGGSTLGYAGAALSALYAQDNPKGEGGKDYRHAVGSAVLNFFDFGWAAPIVHEVAEPALNYTMDNGESVNGVAGAFLADPVGMPISGQYDMQNVLTANLDQANLFGGNPGGSIGGSVAQNVDPIGTVLFGDEGPGGWISDAVNSDPIVKAIGGGCFLTTACMKVMMEDFQDDCHELTQLRKLRDTYISKLPEGPALLQEYYHTAPEIIRAIDRRENSEEIWHQLYNNHILPAVMFMDEDNPRSAYGIYYNMVNWLKGVA